MFDDDVCCSSGGSNGSGNSGAGRDLARGMSYGVPGLPPPTHNVDPLLRMPGVFPQQASRDA